VLYATLNGEGRVVKIDLETGEVIAKVRTGNAPRSMAMSADGEVLYVVNYNSDTMSKVLTDSFEEVQEVRTADKPIGITVDPQNANVWVSNYSGVLQIFEDAVVEGSA
ncbi:MAG: peptidoglycan-binding protein, partial [Acidimicrobiales bacterium]|nr:peptidoglycan-binding protein [Acidimicrobiales bacterium]